MQPASGPPAMTRSSRLQYVQVSFSPPALPQWRMRLTATELRTILAVMNQPSKPQNLLAGHLRDFQRLFTVLVANPIHEKRC
jgi:hypothetical protein